MAYSKAQMDEAINIANQYVPGKGVAKKEPLKRRIGQAIAGKHYSKFTAEGRKQKKKRKENENKLKHSAATNAVRRGLEDAGVNKGTFKSY